MANEKIYAQVTSPIDTKTNWEASKRILLDGEVAYEKETGRYKVGDGTHTWSELEYATTYTHPNSGVTAGTYKSVTVDAKGHVTSGSNPTTLSGYGITDAATSTQGSKADTAVQSVKVGEKTYEGPNVALPEYPTSLPASDVSSWAKASTKPTYTASEVGADAEGSADAALESANNYTDDAIQNVTNEVNTNKADKSTVNNHINDSTIHVTSTDKTHWNDAKSHADSDHAPTNAEKNTIIEIQKNGTKVDISSDRKVNIKVPTSISELTNDSDFVTSARTINNKALSSNITLTASDVDADASGAANNALTSAKAYTDGKIDAIVGTGASETLDTIGEISKAIEENQDAMDALNAAIGNKVDKVSGKGLSTNDLTATLKSNYDAAYTHSTNAHAPSTAEKNTIVSIKKNGTTILPDSSRIVDISVPTKVSELTNDSGFKTTDNNTTYSLSKSGSTITLTGSDGSTTSVTDSDTNTTYGVVSTTANGLAPKRDGSTTKYLRADGTWAIPPDTNTTYSNFVKSGSGAKAGLVPAPSTTEGTTKYLREDGTWAVPPDTNTTYNNATASTAGLIKVSSVNSTAVTVNSESTTSGRYYPIELNNDGKAIVNVPWTDSNTVTTVSTSGSGNAITSITASNGAITATKGSTFLTAHPTISKSTDSTSTASPAHGGTFTVIDSVTRDTNGHVTKVNTKTVTLPSDNNTDTKVSQTLTTSNASYPLLLAPNGQTATTTTSAYFDSGVTLNPSTNTIEANISGTANVAIADDLGNRIADYVNYISSDGDGSLEIAYGTTPSADDIERITIYAHPSYSARTGVPTTNATPGFGGTFSVTQPVSDATGHITAMNSRTVTIPSTTGSATAKGLTKLYTGTGTNTDGTMTQSAITTALSGKASTSHGNHVPTTETANNAKFLRNDNTWQTVTPANIGAATSGHTHSSYVNQNAFSNVKVGDTTIAADSTTDTLTLAAGSNITLTPDATNDKVTITATNTVYTHPSYTARTGTPTGNQTPAFGGTFTLTQPVSDSTGHITAMNSRTITIPNATMTAATSSAAGKIGLVPAPAAGKQTSFLRGDGTWVAITAPESSPTANSVVTNTTELVNAIRALPTTGGKIILREGNYNLLNYGYTINSLNSFTSNAVIVLEGMGQKNTILTFPGKISNSNGTRIFFNNMSVIHTNPNKIGAYDNYYFSNCYVDPGRLWTAGVIYMDNCDIIMDEYTIEVEADLCYTGMEAAEVRINNSNINIDSGSSYNSNFDVNLIYRVVDTGCITNSSIWCNGSNRINLVNAGNFNMIGNFIYLGSDKHSICHSTTETSPIGTFIGNDVSYYGSYLTFATIQGNKFQHNSASTSTTNKLTLLAPGNVTGNTFTGSSLTIDAKSKKVIVSMNLYQGTFTVSNATSGSITSNNISM